MIITLCGSARFEAWFHMWNELRKQGWLPPSPFAHGLNFEEALVVAEKLKRLQHAIRDAETHGWDAASIIRVTEASK